MELIHLPSLASGNDLEFKLTSADQDTSWDLSFTIPKLKVIDFMSPSFGVMVSWDVVSFTLAHFPVTLTFLLSGTFTIPEPYKLRYIMHLKVFLTHSLKVSFVRNIYVLVIVQRQRGPVVHTPTHWDWSKLTFFSNLMKLKLLKNKIERTHPTFLQIKRFMGHNTHPSHPWPCCSSEEDIKGYLPSLITWQILTLYYDPNLAPWGCDSVTLNFKPTKHGDASISLWPSCPGEDGVFSPVPVFTP